MARLEQAASPAVFLDRDGTLIDDVGYLDSVDRIDVFPWTIDAVRSLNRAGLPVVVVTNQSGVARGYLTEALIDEVHRELDVRFGAGGAHVDAYYYCPHHPDGTVAGYTRRCECRKPERGLVERAARDLNLDPTRSFVVRREAKWAACSLLSAHRCRATIEMGICWHECSRPNR